MAYAALLSLMNVLEQVQLHERFHLLVKNQIQSLHEKISFLQEFLEECSLRRGDKAEDLESEIRDIAYAAEDIIEDHLVDYISGESVSEGDESSSLFCQDLEITISDLDFLKEEVMKIKENRGIKDQQLRNPTTAAGSSRAPDETDAIVGSDEHLIRLMDELTGYESNRRIIPIVGMGGIGKTTLAKYVYVNLLIVQHFDIRVWVTVSQEYSVREILLGLCDTLVQEKLEMSDNDRAFGEHVHKSLFGKRYLVVLDDMWSIEAWDEIKMYFPDNNNGSRIVVTTRLLNLAHKFGSRSPYKMSFLGADESWKLFCNKIFGQGSCPVELQEIGKKITRNCEGLPLAIVVIAGFLAKSKRTKEYWEYVAEDLNSIVNSENEEHCLKTLSLSYDHLPNYLKPCFLYMGIFPEDSEISVPRLIKLWVAEGLLKPDRAKHLEEVAEENLQDLVDRNLVLVGKRSRRGKMRTCGMHDLLRDMCIREAQKEKIFYAKRISELKTSPSFDGTMIYRLKTSQGFYATMISRLNTSEDIERARRISIHESTMKYENVSSDAQQSASLCLLSALLARSFLCNLEGISAEIICGKRLLRVLDTVDRLPVNDFLHLVNLRYLDCQIDNIFSPIKHFQHLQTLIIKYPGCSRTVLSSAIWQMPQLRHIHVWLAYLPEPPGESCVLEKLQTLSTILNLRCTEDVIRAIPNVKKLKFDCEETSLSGAKWPYYGLNNLVHMHKLESVTCVSRAEILPGQLAFPSSLKRLSLEGCRLPWESFTNIISPLPNLEVLKLEFNAFCGPVWELAEEDQFPHLKYLSISSQDWEHWMADSTNFPRLECLQLTACRKLNEIPWGIGEIPTLKLIQLYFCSESAAASAKEIVEEQRSLGNDVLQILAKNEVEELLNAYKKSLSFLASKGEKWQVLKPRERDFVANATTGWANSVQHSNGPDKDNLPPNSSQ